MEGHVPPKAPVQTPLTGWGWKEWFQKLYRFFVREADLSVTQTAAFTFGQEYMWPCDATSASFAATLPPANQWLGKKYFIKKIDSSANTVTVTAAGTDTIEGSATKVLSTQYSWIVLVSDGVSTWYQIQQGSSSVGAGVSFLTSGTSVAVPAACSGLAAVTGVAGGGGGAGRAAANVAGAGGGGAGQACHRVLIKVTAGGTLNYTLGTAGTGATGGGAAGTGGDTTFTDADGRVYTLKGGGPAAVGGANNGGQGGGPNAAAVAGASTAGPAAVIETPVSVSGAGGGGAVTGAAPLAGKVGGSCEAFQGGAAGAGAGAANGGSSGGASIFGPSAAGGAANNNGVAAPANSYGCGGSGSGGDGGAGARNGANGGTGALYVEWL